MSEERIGFVGLGNMGSHVAAPSSMPAFGSRASTSAPTTSSMRAPEPSQPWRSHLQSDIVLLSLPDSRVVEAVVFGDDGLMAAAREGTVIVDLSTSSPDSTRRISGELATKRVSFLDAGICQKGTPRRPRREPSHSWWAATQRRWTRKIRGTLDLFSSNIFYCGPSGSPGTR